MYRAFALPHFPIVFKNEPTDPGNGKPDFSMLTLFSKRSCLVYWILIPILNNRRIHEFIDYYWLMFHGSSPPIPPPRGGPGAPAGPPAILEP